MMVETGMILKSGIRILENLKNLVILDYKFQEAEYTFFPSSDFFLHRTSWEQENIK